MDELKRKNLLKHLDSCYTTNPDAEPDLKRKGVLLNLFFFVVTVIVALIVGGQLRDLRFDGGHPGFSYFGDKISDGDVYDYIVVGAGAAGSAVAARLALAGRRVLLIEAGGDPHLLTKIPSAAGTLLGSSLDWFYDTIPNNKSCLSSKGKRCHFSRGRCLGGSTSINYMMYTRGNRQDYDFNLTGWTWKDIEPYFLRYEGLASLKNLPKSSAPYHNTSGVVSVDFFGDSNNPWHKRLIGGLESLYFPYNPDVNAKSQIGVSRILGFTHHGERISTANTYLEMKTVKRKLKIAKNTQCTGVIIDENNVARGVTVHRGGNNTLRLYAKHEVILSAGSIGTAQLLMLSGVGPKDHLKEFGISVKSDLSVGDDMSDHVLPLLFINVDHDQRPLSDLAVLGSKIAEILQWLVTRSGPLSSNSLTDVTAFLNTNCYNYTLRRLVNDRPECELPTLQFIYAYLIKGVGSIGSNLFNLPISQDKEILQQIITENSKSASILVSSVVLQPKSRGWVRLASSDPLKPPAITPNYLDDERDVDEMVRGIKIVEHMVDTPLYKKYNASIHRIKISGCPGIDEDGYWPCYARHLTLSVQHAVGTAALGRVVDERLRVKGIKNLRVCDASVLPHVPRGNTAAAIIAIGERLSDFLIQDHGLE